MKPVNKGKPVLSLANHKQAKPELISRMGSFCSYCEAAGKPQDIDVEHIYPQESHPELAAQWRNFLLPCSTSNT